VMGNNSRRVYVDFPSSVSALLHQVLRFQIRSSCTRSKHAPSLSAFIVLILCLFARPQLMSVSLRSTSPGDACRPV
jgi:hypothetical protein